MANNLREKCFSDRAMTGVQCFATVRESVQCKGGGRRTESRGVAEALTMRRWLMHYYQTVRSTLLAVPYSLP